MSDDYNLHRFVEAQDAGGTYNRAVAELRNGRKLSHWMWFVFPQLRGLGHSATARHYAISSLTEAHAYRAHAVLGPRLLESTNVVAGLSGLSAERIFGSVDAMKLHSSMTLFAVSAADSGPDPYSQVLDLYFDGRSDEATLRLLSAGD